MTRELLADEQEAARHLLWFEGSEFAWEPGSFSQHLVRALVAADFRNTQKLLEAFPAYCLPYQVLTTQGKAELERLLQ